MDQEEGFEVGVVAVIEVGFVAGFVGAGEEEEEVSIQAYCRRYM